MDAELNMVTLGDMAPLTRLRLPVFAYQVLNKPLLAGMGDPAYSCLPWAQLHALGFGYIVCLNNNNPKYDPQPLRFLWARQLEDLCGGRTPKMPEKEKRLYVEAAESVTAILREDAGMPNGVIIHCTGGIGRTGTVIGLVLAKLGFDISKIKQHLWAHGWPESKWQDELVSKHSRLAGETTIQDDNYS